MQQPRYRVSYTNVFRVRWRRSFSVPVIELGALGTRPCLSLPFTRRYVHAYHPFEQFFCSFSFNRNSTFLYSVSIIDEQSVFVFKVYRRVASRFVSIINRTSSFFCKLVEATYALYYSTFVLSFSIVLVLSSDRSTKNSYCRNQWNLYIRQIFIYISVRAAQLISSIQKKFEREKIEQNPVE